MDRKIWKNPESVKSLDEAQCPLWFWNDKLENEELVRQLRLMSEVGVKSCNPHARTTGGEGFIGGYLDDDWNWVEVERAPEQPSWTQSYRIKSN